MNIRRKVVFMALLVILAYFMLFVFQISFDQRIYRDVTELTQQLNESGMDARQIDSIRSMMLSTNRHVSSYVWSAVFIVLIVFTNMFIIGGFLKNQDE